MGRRRYLFPLLALFAACGEPTPIPVNVVVTPGIATADVVGATVQYAAQVIDDLGMPIPGAQVTWSSGREDVATISSTGLATVTGQGTASIRAVHQPVSGSATLVVELTPVRLARVAGDIETAPALSRLPENPTVRIEDAGGAPIPDVRVAFEVLSGGGEITPRSGLTDASGQAYTRWTLGEATGVQVLRATAANLEATFEVTATEPVLAIRRQQLESARVDVAYRRAIGILGGAHKPLAWSISEGRLPSGLEIDTLGVIGGRPSEPGGGSFTVRVADAAGNEAFRELSLRVCAAPLALAAGEVAFANPAGLGSCPPFLPAGDEGDRYRVAVLRVDTSTRPTIAKAELKVVEIGADGERRPEVAGAPPQVAVEMRQLPEALAAGVRIADATARHHALRLAEAERLILRFGPGAVLPDLRDGRPAGAFRSTLSPPPPETMLFRPPEPGANACAAPGPTPVPALLIDYSDHLAVYQDSAQHSEDPVGMEPVRQMLDYYEAHGAGTIEEYFGGVSDINGDERVNVFISPVVRDGIAAFVWGADFLDSSACAASNQMELVYFGLGMFHALAGAPDDGHYQALGTMVHEVKHVSSLYRRSRAGSYHPGWIEEGTAEIAGEISSRKAMEGAGGVALGAMLRRDAYPPRDGSIITPENYAMLLRLVRTALSYTAETNSLTSNPTERHTFYGTSWHFHRFLGDAYGDAAGKAEASFFAALNDTSHAAGTRGIEQAAEESVETLLEEYAVAMMLNGTGAAEPERGFRTYDFPSATSELFRADYEYRPAGSYPWPGTGSEPAGFESFTYTGGLAPAGIRFHEFESDGEDEGIEVEAEVTGATAVRVVIVRVR